MVLQNSENVKRKFIDFCKMTEKFFGKRKNPSHAKHRRVFRLSSLIFTVQQPQAVQQQIFIVHYLFAAVRNDHSCQTARRYNGCRFGKRLVDTLDQPVNHGGVRIHNTASHAVHGIRPNEGFGTVDPTCGSWLARLDSASSVRAAPGIIIPPT